MENKYSEDRRECRCRVHNSCCSTRRTESNAGPKARRVNTHTWEAPRCGNWKILFMSLLWCWLWIHAGQDSTEMHHEHHVRQLPVLLDINSEWWILTAHLNRSAWFPLTFPLKWFEFCECLRMMIHAYNGVVIVRIDRNRYVFADATHESNSGRSRMGRTVH